MRLLPALGLAFLGCMNPRYEKDFALREGSVWRYKMAQEKGERLLMKEREKGMEDAFLYADGEWTDIGYDEKEHSVLNDDHTIDYFIKERNPEEITFYHLHPSKENLAPSHFDVLRDAFFRKRYPDKEIHSRVAAAGGYWEYRTTEDFNAPAFSAKGFVFYLLSRKAFVGGKASEEAFVEKAKNMGIILIPPE